ncbi:MAG TPA: hypothetical protein ENJ02_03565 [Chloroflexi bacterium]|nr:hypothetical protein [Chloroflexota bacterium]
MFRKISFRATSLIVALVLALGSAIIVLAATVTVDTFDDGGQQVCIGGSSSLCTTFSIPSDNSIAAAGALGGERDIRLTNYSGAPSSQVFLRAAQTGALNLSLSQDNNVSALAEITWDGTDGDATVLNYGLTADLTDGGTNDLFAFTTLNDDLPINVEIRVYCNATDWSYATFALPGDISSSHVDSLIPFTDFVAGGGAGCPPQNTNITPARAVQLLIDGSVNAGADLDLDDVKTDSVRDYGDLPVGYGDASHIANGIRLGDNVDAESASANSANADGDDNNSVDDEDGITRDPNDFWVAGNTVHITATVAGCSGNCYLNGWIDWDGNGTMDGSEAVFTEQTVSNGPNVLSINVPAGYTTGTSVYVRFRLCGATGSCNAPTGSSASGEVEDYQWQFGPTAITLDDMSAASGTPYLPLALAGAAFVLVAGAGLVLRKRYLA